MNTMKGLRRRFVLSAMVSFLLVLTVIIAGINVLNYCKVVKEADFLLQLMSENRGGFHTGPGAPDLRLPPSLSPEIPFESRYFTVTLDAVSGETLEVNTSRIAAIDEDHTATLTVNGVSAEYTVNGLQIKELYLEDDGSGAVTLSYSSDGKVRVDLTYSDYEHVDKAGAFYAYLEGDIHKYGTAYLAINLECYSGQRQLSISLPPSLRVSGGAAGNGVYCSAKHEQVSVYVSKDFSGTVYLPLLVTQTGNYKIEPIRLTTEAGNRYYSNELTLDIE